MNGGKDLGGERGLGEKSGGKSGVGEPEKRAWRVYGNQQWAGCRGTSLENATDLGLVVSK